ncbi:MAG: hypothetical protein KDD00_15685 [Ignavibacteriae bacterium]|nr:hypothetical protein [Ignavibacteriota bacterium]
MEKTKTQNDLKPLIRETINEMIRDDREEIRELIKEAIEDIALANAVKEGKKNEYVSEEKILKLLDK